MFFKYPYTDLYNLNLDWMIQAIKEVQETITALGNVVHTFNGRDGNVTLEADDVNDLAINSVTRIYVPIEQISQETLNTLYSQGVRVVLEISAGKVIRISFLTAASADSDVNVLEYETVGAVDSVNGEAGDVILTAEDIEMESGQTLEAVVSAAVEDIETLFTDVSIVTNMIAPVVENPPEAAISANDFFVTDNTLRRALVAIPAGTAITDTNSELVPEGGLNAVYAGLANNLYEVYDMVFPEGGTPGTFLQLNAAGETVWGAPATDAQVGTAVTNWLTANVPTGTTVVIDRSLTVTDAAADSATVGDKFDVVDNDVSDLKSALENSNEGYSIINTTYVHGRIRTDTENVGIVQQSEAYKYQAVTPNIIVFDYDVELKVNTGYQFLVFFYDSSDAYLKHTSAWQTVSYQIPANSRFRLFVSLNPQDNTANVAADVFSKQINASTPILARIVTIEDVQEAVNASLHAANEGNELIDTTLIYGRILTTSGHVGEVDLNNIYNFQAVTPDAISFSKARKIIAKPGYVVQLWWYDENDVYVSRTGSFVSEYTMVANRRYRLFIRFNPHDTSAVMDLAEARANVVLVSDIGERVDSIETTPLSTLPNYILNTLSNKPLGSLSKGYILLAFDDGAKTLATGTIPLLIANDVPGTFGLLPQSEIFASGNETELATVVDAVENHGCVVAMHGSTLWPTYTESELYQYFESTVALFNDKNLGNTYGAICPGGVGDDTSSLVKAVAGGYFGYVFSGNRADKISYDTVSNDGKYNGARSNRYDLDRRSGIGITSAKAHDIVAYAAENHLLLCAFWHDNTLNDANHTEYVTYFNNLITEAKASGLTFITAKDLPNIT